MRMTNVSWTAAEHMNLSQIWNLFLPWLDESIAAQGWFHMYDTSIRKRIKQKVCCVILVNTYFFLCLCFCHMCEPSYREKTKNCYPLCDICIFTLRLILSYWFSIILVVFYNKIHCSWETLSWQRPNPFPSCRRSWHWTLVALQAGY